MTDKETVIDMLKRANIEYTTFPESDDIQKKDSNVSLCIEAGYIGFYSVICFNTDGSLHAIEAYE